MQDYLKCPTDDPEMGVGHGIAGILYMLLAAMKILPQLKYPKMVNKVKETLNKIVTIIEK